MRGLHYRSAYAIGLLGSAALFVRPAAASGEVEVQSSMQCDRAIEPGRVRCTVEARVAAGRTIAWADVEILMLPEFVLWNGLPQNVRFEDPTLMARLDWLPHNRLRGRALDSVLGFTPQRLVLTLSRPIAGHCYKVAAAALPRL